VWETFSFLARGKFRKAFRRREKNGTLANMYGEKVWVHYYSPHDVVQLFGRYFRYIEHYGVNIFTPPPTSRLANKLLQPFARVLARLDELVAHVKPFSNSGDHFVIVLQRKN
jgi:hypothetical protein